MIRRGTTFLRLLFLSLFRKIEIQGNTRYILNFLCSFRSINDTAFRGQSIRANFPSFLRGQSDIVWISRETFRSKLNLLYALSTTYVMLYIFRIVGESYNSSLRVIKSREDFIGIKLFPFLRILLFHYSWILWTREQWSKKKEKFDSFRLTSRVCK